MFKIVAGMFPLLILHDTIFIKDRNAKFNNLSINIFEIRLGSQADKKQLYSPN